MLVSLGRRIIKPEQPQLQPPLLHPTHLHEQVLSSGAIPLEMVGQKVLEGVVMLSLEVEFQ